ncbi:MAG: acyl transferase [Raineya sp.]|nr:acyl transferase [Raineya sp.]MDW8297594.1 acyl transferase [Raineya sp.]
MKKDLPLILKNIVLNIQQEDEFESLALLLYDFQLKNNPIFAQWVSFFCENPYNIQKIEQIPCLPIEFFKYHTIRSISKKPTIIFESSGTTQTPKSRHLLTDSYFYVQNSIQIFEKQYGSLENYHILALLPSYLERENSSLVYMVNEFMKKSASPYNTFYLYDFEKLFQTIQFLRKNDSERKILLWGVTYALLDFAEKFGGNDFSDIIIMETGGMKGRRKEMTRAEVHQILQKAFGVKQVHSEYGMTELLSQAYSQGEGIFEMPLTMRIFLRENNDPLTYTHTRGLINVIDLANIESCAFIATQDVGTLIDKNKFMVLGRADNAEQRGCNLLLEQF